VAEQPVLLPGEAEQERARRRRTDGVPVDVETVERLASLAKELGVTFPLTEELA
jgi:LDH2 family malate/lactate/ureidoglycolate dehydrogenase